VGTKSGILPSLTTLVVSGGFSVAALRSLTIVVAEWIKRCGARKAVLVVGEYRLEIEGASKKTQDAAVNAFIQAAAADGSATISPPVHSTLAHAPLEGSRGEV
jgi:hypothetical protein